MKRNNGNNFIGDDVEYKLKIIKILKMYLNKVQLNKNYSIKIKFIISNFKLARLKRYYFISMFY